VHHAGAVKVDGQRQSTYSCPVVDGYAIGIDMNRHGWWFSEVGPRHRQHQQASDG
jgi:hypothetical protein